MRVAQRQVPTTGRHAHAQVPAEEARTVALATRTGRRSAHYRGRLSPSRRRRWVWLLAIELAILASILAPTPPPPAPPSPDTSPPGPTARTADRPNGPTGNWIPIFADEFDGTALDTTRWLPCVSHGQLPYPAKCTGWNSELQRYSRDNIEVRDGALRLIAKKETGRFTSGAITTARDVFGFDQAGYTEFTYTYGYVEVRFRGPQGPGTWPAVWGLPYNSDGDEIDVVEIIDGAAYFTHHTGSPTSGGQYELTGTDFTRGWHVVGTEWEPGRLTWYVDGEPVYTLTDEVPDRPFFIQANLAIGGEWPGPPTAETQFPTSFDIDYIRVFQHRP